MNNPQNKEQAKQATNPANVGGERKRALYIHGGRDVFDSMPLTLTKDMTFYSPQ